MQITEVDIRHFRSLKKFTWEPSRCNVICGVNSSGKSNVRRAMQFAFRESFEPARVNENICFDSPGPRTAARITLKFDKPTPAIAAKLQIPPGAAFTYTLQVRRSGSHTSSINSAPINEELRQAFLSEVLVVYLRDTLLITGQSRTYSGVHQRETNVAIESDLAHRFHAAYAFVMGVRCSDTTVESLPDIDKVRSWLFGHFRGLLSQESVVARDVQSGKLCRGFPMGIDLLEQQDLDAFSRWFRRSSGAFDGWPLHRRDLTAFYGAVGYRSVGDRHRTSVLSQLDHVSDALKASDPLTEPGLKRGSSEFQRLTDLATLAKLRSAEMVQLQFDEFTEDVRLLYRVPIKILPGSTPPRLAERRGAHLALVGLIVDAARALRDGDLSLVVSVSGHSLHLRVNKGSKCVDDIQAQLDSRLLWHALIEIFGIERVKEDSECWSATVPSVSDGDALSRDVLDCWSAFASGGSLAAATDSAMATLLHDVKNEVLAYQSAASQAQGEGRTSVRYALAAAASRHAEQALSRLDVVRGLLASAQTQSYSSINLATMFRSMTNDMLAWLPASVHLEMPKIDPAIGLCSNEAALRSLLGNLVRNAVDAMDTSGTIGIECLVDEDEGQVEFEVRDTGPGFRPEQLEALNRGQPVSTTKVHGSGLGLLTVLVLANSLGGRATFASKAGSGSRVLLTIPMNSTEASSPPGAIDMSSPKQEVKFV